MLVNIMLQRTRLLLVPLALSGSLFLIGDAVSARDFDSQRLERLLNRSSDARSIMRAERSMLHREVGQVQTPEPVIPTVESVTPTGCAVFDQTNTRTSEHSLQLDSRNRLRGISHNLNLDLGSTNRTIQLGSEIFANRPQVSIQVGDAQKILTAGALVTPSEFVALKQVVEQGAQSLSLSAQGAANDGIVELSIVNDPSRKTVASSVIIPNSVEVIGNFGKNADFQIKGDLVNSGLIYAQSPESRRATFIAQNILNQETGVITTIAPSSSGSDKAKTDLALHASRQFSNFGKIESSGSLSISSGDAVVNSGSMLAADSVNIETANVRNSGSIVSSAGNIALTTATPSAIEIDNGGGQFVAEFGAITVRDQAFAEKLNTTLHGGDWLSKELNICAGEGTLNLQARNVSGAVNIRAGIAHVSTDTDSLLLNSVIASGDPTITNTGDILQGSISTGGGPLTLVAGRDIFLLSNTSLDTNNPAGTAGDITLIAGAAFEDAASPTHPGEVWVTGPSATGGNIDAIGIPTNASIQANGLNGGNIQLVAYKQNNSSGSVVLHNTSIEALGTTGGANGNLSVYAADPIQIYRVDVNGVSNNTGNVFASNESPTIVGGAIKIDEPTGAIISGSFTGGTVGTGSIDFRVIDSGNDVELRAGAFISTLGVAVGSIVADRVVVNLPTGPANFAISDINSIAVTGSGGGLTLANNGDLLVESLPAAFNANSDITATGNVTTSGAILNTGSLLISSPKIVLGGALDSQQYIHLTQTSGDFNISQNITANTGVQITSTTGDVNITSVIDSRDVAVHAENQIKVSGTLWDSEPTFSKIKLETSGELRSEGITGLVQAFYLELVSINSNIGHSQEQRFVATLGVPGIAEPGQLSARADNGSVLVEVNANVNLYNSGAKNEFNLVATGGIGVGSEINSAQSLVSTAGNVVLDARGGDIIVETTSSVVSPNEIILTVAGDNRIISDGTVIGDRLLLIHDSGDAIISQSNVAELYNRGASDLKILNNIGDLRTSFDANSGIKNVEIKTSGNLTIGMGLNTEGGVKLTAASLTNDPAGQIAATGPVLVIVDGDINFTSNIHGTSADVRSLNGDINLSGWVTSPEISFYAHGTINNSGYLGNLNPQNPSSLSITTDGDLASLGIGGIFAGSISLESINGSIGSSTDRLLLYNDAGTEPKFIPSLNLRANNGSVYVHNVWNLLLQSSHANGNFDLLTGNQLIVGSGQTIDTANGDISLVSSLRTLEIGNSANIAASQGNVYIQNVGTDRRADKFVIGDDVKISAISATAGKGNVTLALGAIPANLRKGKIFNRKTITATELDGGEIVWGNKKWRSNEKPVVVTAKGANVIFSNIYPGKNAVIGSGVEIIADPPGKSSPLGRNAISSWSQ